MRLLFTLVSLLFTGLLIGVVALVAVAVEDVPRLDRPIVITPQQIARAKRIVEGQHPSKRREHALATMALPPEDVDLAVNYLANRFAHGGAGATLSDGAAHVTVSVPLPSNPFGSWLNIEAGLAETETLPRLQSLRIGGVPLPGRIAAAIGDTVLEQLRRRPDTRPGIEALQAVRFAADGVKVVYTWSDDLVDRTRAATVTPADRARMRRYQEQLAAIPGARVALPELLVPLMRRAAQQGGDAAAENRAALLVLTMHVLGHRLEMVEPEARGWPHPPRRVVTLAGRDDFPKHFMVSAALAAFADTTLADAIGLQKEIEDSRGGSGFSFNDIAADRAGTAFGARAVEPGTAAALQARVAAGVGESDILPATADLPEFMSEKEFIARFGSVGAPAYRRMMDDIEGRVAALPVLR
jgi:hypothetical protein